MEIELKAKDIHKMGNKYVCYVQVNSIPESIMDWMSTNPREQTEKKKVVKEIKESLINNYNFHELNRGIVESVYKVYHNSSDELRLTFENPEIHGNIDGGHTLKNILNVIKEGEIPDDRYVFMEIFEGIKNRAELAKLAKARNTSMQVDDASIAELEDKFKSIKEVLKKVPFENRIRYKANQHSTEFLNREIISIEKIISILTMYNLDDYKLLDTSTKRLSKSHPIHTYSVKKNCLQKFIKNEDRDLMIKNMQPIIIDIFKLYDEIEKTFPDAYNKTGKKYGSKKYSKYNDGKCVGKSCFYGEDLSYEVPDGIMYPLLSAFRSIVGVDNETGLYYWIKNPLKTWDSLKDELVTTVSNNANLDNIPILGKDYSLWDALLKTVYFYTRE